jgi:hypothetical protein
MQKDFCFLEEEMMPFDPRLLVEFNHLPRDIRYYSLLHGKKGVLSYEPIHPTAQFYVMTNGANSKQAAN